MGKGKGSTATATATTQARRASVPADKFVSVWTKGCVAGKSAKEIAGELGMDVDSATVRASQMRKRLKAAGVELPSPAGNTGGGKKLDIAALAGMVKSLQAVDADEPATETPTPAAE